MANNFMVKLGRAIELKKLLFLPVKNDHENVKVTQDTQFYGLFKHRPFSLRVSGHSLFVVFDVGKVIRGSFRFRHVLIIFLVFVLNFKFAL